MGRVVGRWLMLGFGWVCVGLGLLGVALPGVPTTPFLLLAAWAFARSSDRFRDWLWNHPRLGPPVRAWEHHRVISPRAKAASIAAMTLSIAVVGLFVAESWLPPVGMAMVMAPVAAFILSRADAPPPVPESAGE